MLFVSSRYVDDILIIYNTHITPETINEQINNIHPNLYFTPTQEQNNTINFLDLLLIRQPTTIDIDIFRKPTTTDTTIDFTSNHPTEHKMAAHRYLINRMLTLPLSTKRKKIELQKILTIANNNISPPQLISELKAQMQQKTLTITTKEENRKWTIFTYHSSKIRKITNLFKHTDIKIAFHSTSTVQTLAKPKTQNST